MRVLAFGTYERDYPRNAIAVEGMRRVGVEVLECHRPVWELTRHKAGDSLSPLAVTEWAWRYARSVRQLVRAARAERFDCVLVGYPAHVDLPMARLIAGSRPVVFNPLVSLFDTLVGDRGRFTSGGVAARVLRGMDRIAFRLADSVVMDTQEHARWLAGAQRVDRARIEVIPVGAEDVFHPLGEIAPPAEELVVLFYGKMIPLHGVEYILDAAELLKEERVRFKLVGSGQLDGWLAAEIGRRGLENVKRQLWVDYADLPAELCSSHIALGIFGTGDKAQRVVPNKAFQALGCGIPLITADTPAAREFLHNGRDALLVRAGDGRALADAVMRIKGDEELRLRIGAEGRALFKQHFTVERIGSAFAAVCQGAVGRSTCVSRVGVALGEE